MDKPKVGVIFGGRSVEHDVSILTGLQVLHYIDRKKYDPIPIYISRSGEWFFGDALTRFETYQLENIEISGAKKGVILPDRISRGLLTPPMSGLLTKNEIIDIDVAFPAIHGTHGEDGTLQGLLEMADIPYTGCGVSASMIGMNKILTKKILKYHDIPVFDFVQLQKQDWESDRKEIYSQLKKAGLKYPLFVKPSNLGSSIGISKAKNKDEFEQALETAFAYDDLILIENEAQDFIEINCAVIRSLAETRTSVCEQPVHWEEFLTFDDKYMQGEANRGMEGAERKIPAPISAKLTKTVKEMAAKTFEAIGGYGISRIDFFVNPRKNEVFVNEINTLPGSLSFYLWQPSGLPPAELIDKLIEIALEINRNQSSRILSFNSGLVEKAAREGVKFGNKV